jgi:antitoxin component of MazEF toxin-antitoxin module
MTKLTSIGGSLAVIIPADIVRQAGLKKGQPVDVRVDAGGKIFIAPAAKPDWASFFAREIDPEIASWELEREQPESRNVFGFRDYSE